MQLPNYLYIVVPVLQFLVLHVLGKMVYTCLFCLFLCCIPYSRLEVM
ncbi:unnamed protein product [Trichobilharzia regenti]|nr:unnamed protein product [Trichobilharzia regenti]